MSLKDKIFPYTDHHYNLWMTRWLIVSILIVIGTLVYFFFSWGLTHTTLPALLFLLMISISVFSGPVIAILFPVFLFIGLIHGKIISKMRANGIYSNTHSELTTENIESDIFVKHDSQDPQANSFGRDFLSAFIPTFAVIITILSLLIWLMYRFTSDEPGAGTGAVLVAVIIVAIGFGGGLVLAALVGAIVAVFKSRKDKSK